MSDDNQAKTETPIPWGRLASGTFLTLLVLVFVVKVLFTATIDQNEKAAEFSYGRPVRNIEEPGLNFMWPWHSVTRLEKRYMLYDSDPHEIITKDKKTLVTDDFAPWRITDPTLFIRSVGSASSALTRIDDSVYSRLIAAFGGRDFSDIVVQDREDIIKSVTDGSRLALAPNGIDMGAVLVSRIDLPEENKDATYNRMSAERHQTAQTYRSEGNEEALKITSEADRDAKILVANAKRDAEIVKGNADAQAAQIYADAYSQSPDFYALVRGLEASENAFGPDSGTDLRMILKGNESVLKSLLK